MTHIGFVGFPFDRRFLIRNEEVCDLDEVGDGADEDETVNSHLKFDAKLNL
jgi:hypothetical protein